MKLQIVCHRGANKVAPENTLKAAEICFANGYDYVELDLRTTGDGRLVIMHDATVDRTTGGTGSVADAAWDDLADLDAGSWFASQFADQRIPLFSDMLALAAAHGGKLYVDLKAVAPAAMLAEVAAANMMDRCFFGSERPDVMRQVRSLAPQAMLMARRCDFGAFEQAVEDSASQIIEFDQRRDDLSELASCRSAGLWSMVYDQTDDIGGMETVIDLGPNLVNVDRPDLAKQVRDRRASS